MATKTTVTLDGTRFNIFKLVKLISKMQTSNEGYNKNVAPLKKREKSDEDGALGE